MKNNSQNKNGISNPQSRNVNLASSNNKKPKQPSTPEPQPDDEEIVVIGRPIKNKNPIIQPPQFIFNKNRLPIVKQPTNQNLGNKLLDIQYREQFLEVMQEAAIKLEEDIRDSGDKEIVVEGTKIMKTMVLSSLSTLIKAISLGKSITDIINSDDPFFEALRISTMVFMSGVLLSSIPFGIIYLIIAILIPFVVNFMFDDAYPYYKEMFIKWRSGFDQLSTVYHIRRDVFAKAFD